MNKAFTLSLLAAAAAFAVFSTSASRRGFAQDVSVSTPAPTMPVSMPPPAVPAEARPGRAVYNPPMPPAHARRNLDTAAELAWDLQEVVAFLEAGQSYYRAYQKGNHTVDENKAFLRFLEIYEKELAISKKETDALRKWVADKGALDSSIQP